MSMKTPSGDRNMSDARPAERPRRGGRRWPLPALLTLVLLALVGLTAKAVLDERAQAARPSGSAGGAGGATATSAVKAAGNPVITEIMTSNKGTVTTADGEYTDWIELTNPTDAPLDLKGYLLSDNLKKPAKCMLPSYILQPGQSVLVFADGGKSTDKELHAAFKLSGSGTIVLLTDPEGGKLQSVDCPALGVDESYAADAADRAKWAVSKRPTPGYPNTDDGYADYLKTREASSPLVLSEVMTDNKSTVADENGEYDDWVEIYNPSDQTVDLTGWGLSDRISQPKSWAFPSRKLGPGQYLVVFLSGKDRSPDAGELHADFRLDSQTGTVFLSNRMGQIVTRIEAGKLEADTSFGVAQGKDAPQVLAHPTPGYSNDDAGWQAFQKAGGTKASEPVRVNEVMSRNNGALKDQFGETPDWIEIVNRSDKSVSLKGYGLSDKTGEPGRWQFPDITLEAGGHLVVFASGRNLSDSDALQKRMLHTNFKLGGDGCKVILTAPDGHVADLCRVPALKAGVSYGRASDKQEFAFFAQPTPGKANGTGSAGVTADPAFSVKAGMYDKAKTVEITCADEGATIYYTTDGTAPGKSSKRVVGPIEVAKTTAIRAIAYRDGYLPSAAVCSTWLIGENIKLPVVSVVTDPKNLFDKATGINENIYKDWEKPAHLELLEVDGTVGISQDIGIKIFGGISKRNNKQKSYALMSRSEYGKSTFDCKVFPDQTYTSYKDLVIRNSGQDANTSRIRADLMTDLVKDNADVDIQATRQCVVFINGQFWGVYDLMEKLNEHMVAQHHDLDADKIDLLGANGTVIAGSNKEYLSLIQYIKTHDMSKQEYYDYVAARIDIDNYIDWCCIETFTVNSDLGNVKFWKPQTKDGKWRWILYDMDYCYYFVKDFEYYLDPFERFFDARGNGIGHMFDNTIARALIKNAGFRQKFIERFAYHCNVTFEKGRVLKLVDELVANIEPYMARDKAKWHTGTVASWKASGIGRIKDFAEARTEMNIQCFKKFFHLSDAEMKKLFP